MGLLGWMVGKGKSAVKAAVYPLDASANLAKKAWHASDQENGIPPKDPWYLYAGLIAGIIGGVALLYFFGESARVLFWNWLQDSSHSIMDSLTYSRNPGYLILYFVWAFWLVIAWPVWLLSFFAVPGLTVMTAGAVLDAEAHRLHAK